MAAQTLDEAESAYQRGDYAVAFEAFSALADQGEVDAQFNLGVMYVAGLGVSQDDVEAVRWFQQAAEQGHSLAQHNLGAMYAQGRGVPQDDAEAVRWYRQAAGQGLARAQFVLGVMYAEGRGGAQDDVEAVRWYRAAADQGLARAQYNLGAMYFNGRGGPQDEAEAVRWFRTAADQGEAFAQSNLGRMYELGQGVPQDDAAAVRWYRAAADQGLARAQYNLGVMYAEGRGGRRMTLRRSAGIGQPLTRAWPVRSTISERCISMVGGGPQDEAEAVRWFRTAADQGEARAQYALGRMYEAGRGVPQDDVLGHKWLNLSASRLSGSEREFRDSVVQARNLLESKMTPAQIAEAQRLASEWQPGRP